MKRLSDYLRNQLSRRQDSEFQQAVLRLVLVVIAVSYGLSVEFDIWIGLTGLAITIGIVGHIIRSPEPRPARRVIGAIHDNVMTTLFLFFSGPKAALYVFVYPFVTVGNGFRFGVKYLAFSGLLGAVGIGCLVQYGPGWASEKTIGLGVLLSHAVVTLYTGLLLRKLHQAQQKLTKMATHDSLTGLPNRGAFMDSLTGAVRKPMPEHHGVTCVYFDLDGFKAVNDSLGHKSGDVLLVMVAHRVRGVIRSTDMLARLGGDEFTILLDTQTSLADARNVAERIVKTIEDIKTIEGQPVRVSASVGLAHLPARECEVTKCPEELLKRADENMYQAKKKGKGRVEGPTLETARAAS